MSVIDKVLRTFKRFTGDGLPGEPVGAPLPIGDPRSGAHTPTKQDLRDAFSGAIGAVDAVRDEAQGHAESSATSAATATTKAGQAASSASVATDKAGEAIAAAEEAAASAFEAEQISLPDRLGNIADAVDTLDLDDAIHNGWYRANAPANSPFTGWVSVNVYATDTNHITQDCWKASLTGEADSSMMRRIMAAGAFGAWFKVVSTETEIKALAAATPFTGPAPSAADFGFSDDFDNIIVGGQYGISGSWTNGPSQAASTGYAATLEVVERPWTAGARIVQTCHEVGKTHRRWGNGNPISWTSWAKVAFETDLFGVGQTWQNMFVSRAHSTSYQNITGRTIMVSIVGHYGGGGRGIQISTDNSTWVDCGTVSNQASGIPSSFPVPDGAYYRIDGSCSIYQWTELRA